ncbi:male sterility protein-domain-containing protein [Aspergillus multicolor]|uniref:male sterility protein-domain-containing protein n=1 Tax=Aspergillus multicolor TaxID=41759 RepID=UPI003CCCC9DF
MYCEHTFNCMSYEQMREVTKILAERIGNTGGTLKVLEMGAGTGGTTLVMAPFLATLAKSGALPIEYTFTDISPHGNLPENSFQKVIIALASGSQGPRLPKPEPVETLIPELDPENIETRTANAESQVVKYTTGWKTPKLRVLDRQADQKPSNVGAPHNGKSFDAVVIVTGATGSLSSQVVQKLAETPSVATVVCLNRRSSSSTPEKRQHEASTTRGINLSPAARAKLRILETDTSKPQLGLPPLEYSWLPECATDIVHNAWPMSGTRPVSAFEPQLQAMRNLLDLAREIASRPSNTPSRVGFGFVSSIGVVGFCGKSFLPEDRVPFSATLPSGYGEAKWICERILDETLHQHPKLFRALVVRPGQLSGSSVSGFWNPVEHFAFLVKSSQSLRAWPDLQGQMQWIPVDYSRWGCC